MIRDARNFATVDGFRIIAFNSDRGSADLGALATWADIAAGVPYPPAMTPTGDELIIYELTEVARYPRPEGAPA